MDLGLGPRSLPAPLPTEASPGKDGWNGTEVPPWRFRAHSSGELAPGARNPGARGRGRGGGFISSLSVMDEVARYLRYLPTMGKQPVALLLLYLSTPSSRVAESRRRPFSLVSLGSLSMSRRCPPFFLSFLPPRELRTFAPALSFQTRGAPPTRSLPDQFC